MKNIFKKQIDIASSIENNTGKLTYLTSVLRSILQLSVVSSLEIIKAQTPSDEIDLDNFINRFCKPVDGLQLQILDNIIPFIRRYVDKQFLYGWFELTNTVKTPLNKQLIKWVEFRNKRPGHGVLDTETTNEWVLKTAQIIKDCLKVFRRIIPTHGNDSSALSSLSSCPLSFQIPCFAIALIITIA